MPDDSVVNAHKQERQNIIFTVYTYEPIEMDRLVSVKNHIQKRLDDYNTVNRTKFVLSSLDYEQVEVRKTYGTGSGIALIVSIIIGLAFLFVRKEFYS